MNPAACARAKKALRPAREETAPEPKPTPLTPEDATREAYRQYREHTRPYRRVFRGIITRREAERFVVARVKKQNAVIQELKEHS